MLFRSKQMMHITPNDVPALPERVGKMVFDRVMMRWVKATALATSGFSVETHAESEPEDNGQDNESEDPFRDIESLREEDEESQTSRFPEDTDRLDDDEDSMMVLEKSRIEEVMEEGEEDVEETELTSFSTDGPSQDFVHEIHTGDGLEHLESSYTDRDRKSVV